MAFNHCHGNEFANLSLYRSRTYRSPALPRNPCGRAELIRWIQAIAVSGRRPRRHAIEPN